jgi:hypothetical protein
MNKCIPRAEQARSARLSQYPPVTRESFVARECKKCELWVFRENPARYREKQTDRSVTLYTAHGAGLLQVARPEISLQNGSDSRTTVVLTVLRG